MTDDIFDFGFTAVDESELEAVQNTQVIVTEYDKQLSGLQDRLDGIYSAILPLLTNLKKNPEKDYIYWPDRVAKIDQFTAKLETIYKGK